MDIKEKIEEMERIAREINNELKIANLYFSWTINLRSSEIDRAAFGLDAEFFRLREKLYEDLFNAGYLPKKDSPAETPPDGE